jgi:hypothetical protein
MEDCWLLKRSWINGDFYKGHNSWMLLILVPLFLCYFLSHFHSFDCCALLASPDGQFFFIVHFFPSGFGIWEIKKQKEKHKEWTIQENQKKTFKRKYKTEKNNQHWERIKSKIDYLNNNLRLLWFKGKFIFVPKIFFWMLSFPLFQLNPEFYK